MAHLRVVLALALMAGAVGLTAIEAAAAGCLGKQATMTGTGRRDFIRGTGRADVISSRGGNDVVVGRGGNDLICTGSGDDSARGQGGRDRIKAGGGDDVLSGDGGNDLILGGGGSDESFGGRGRDTLKGGGGTFDLLAGNEGNDRLLGGQGQDNPFGGPGNDLADGGAGPFDVASYLFSPAPVTADLAAGSATGEGTDVLRNVEGLEGSPQNDTLRGGGGLDFFWDTPGDDSMDGLDGLDLVSFFSSALPVTANLATDSATGQGTDSIANIEQLVGTFNGGDVLTGDAGPNEIFGLDGDDSLAGDEGDDLLDGQLGNDTGDGGGHVAGDRCVSIEAPTDCEAFARSATGARTVMAAPRQSRVFR